MATDAVEEPHGLLGTAEVAALLGWDRRKVATYLGRGKLPKPAARLACGPIWQERALRGWAHDLGIPTTKPPVSPLPWSWPTTAALADLPEPELAATWRDLAHEDQALIAELAAFPSFFDRQMVEDYLVPSHGKRLRVAVESGLLTTASVAGPVDYPGFTVSPQVRDLLATQGVPTPSSSARFASHFCATMEVLTLRVWSLEDAETRRIWRRWDKSIQVIAAAGEAGRCRAHARLLLTFIAPPPAETRVGWLNAAREYLPDRLKDIAVLRLADALRLSGQPESGSALLADYLPALPDCPNFEAARAVLQGEFEMKAAGSQAAQAPLEQAVKKARKNASPSLLARLLTKLGFCLKLSGKTLSAAAYLEEAVAVAESVGDVRRKAYALGNLAITTTFLNAPRARSLLTEARDTFAALGDLEASAIVAIQFGILDSLAGAHSESLKSFQQALHLYRKNGNLRGIGIAHTNLADTSHALGSVHTAEHHMKAGRALGQQTKTRFVEGNSECQLGRLALERGQWSEASRSLQSAYELLGDREEFRALVDISLAIVDAVDGATHAANARFDHAVATIHRISARELLVALRFASAALFAAHALAARGKGNAEEAERLEQQAQQACEARSEVMGCEELIFLRLARSLLERCDEVPALGPQAMLVGRRGHWFRSASALGEVDRRDRVRRVLFALVEASGAEQSIQTLFAQVWTEERVSQEVQGQRVRNAISQLRKLGCTVIRRGESGYSLAPETDITLWPPIPHLVRMD